MWCSYAAKEHSNHRPHTVGVKLDSGDSCKRRFVGNDKTGIVLHVFVVNAPTRKDQLNAGRDNLSLIRVRRVTYVYIVGVRFQLWKQG